MKFFEKLFEHPGFVHANTFENEGFVFFDASAAGGTLFGVIEMTEVVFLAAGCEGAEGRFKFWERFRA